MRGWVANWLVERWDNVPAVEFGSLVRSEIENLM